LDRVESIVFLSNNGKVLNRERIWGIIKEAAIGCQMPYITERWIGGTITNFGAVGKVIKKYTQLKEKKALLEASKKNYQNLENRVAYEVEDLHFKIVTYKDIISLYKTTLIPQTEQSFQAAKTIYEAGKVDFLNWLESERVFLQTRLAYYRAIVDYQKSIAYLERVVGQDL